MPWTVMSPGVRETSAIAGRVRPDAWRSWLRRNAVTARNAITEPSEHRQKAKAGTTEPGAELEGMVPKRGFEPRTY